MIRYDENRGNNAILYKRIYLDLWCPCILAPVFGVDALEVKGIRPDVVDRAIRGIGRSTVVLLSEL
jgi:hypothetical protein